MSLIKRFQKDMGSFFGLIEDQEKVEADTNNSTASFLQEKFKSYFRTNEWENLDQGKRRKEYREAVQRYTSTKIGSKVSPNTELFTQN